MRAYLICYDIPDDRRRQKVATLLEGYGGRRQYSVFECQLKDSQFAQLWEQLTRRITSEDNLLCVSLCRRCQGSVKTLGAAHPMNDDPDHYLI